MTDPSADASLDLDASGPLLRHEDAAAVDRLVENAFEIPAGLEPEVQSRADAARRLLGRIDRYPVEEPSEEDLDALTDATLARIDLAERDTERRLQIANHPSRVAQRRLSDFVGVAAVFILAVSIVVPLSNHVRHERGIARCGEGLRDLGSAFGRYSASNNGAMPWAASLLPGVVGEGTAAIPKHFEVGGRYRHGEHLRESLLGSPDPATGQRDPGYLAKASSIACPNHPNGEAGCYSYRLPAHRGELTWGFEPSLVVVGDRNPVIELVLGGQRVRLEMNSPEHADRGQNLLRGDGSVQFLRSPLIRIGGGEDNIWLPDDGDDSVRRRVVPVAGRVFLVN